jgi:hypothetical protein
VVEHPVVGVPHLRQRVDELAAEHADEELVRLLHVGHGDPHVVPAAQPWYRHAISSPFPEMYPI